VSRIFAQITMSLDGFTAGPDDGPAHPLGRGGLPLHRWILDGAKTPTDELVMREMFAGLGAVVLGRRMADIGIPLWGESGGFGVPAFVVTHRPAPPLVRGPTTFTYVTDGVERAVTRALAAAQGKEVCIAGGADLTRQAIALGLVDELRLSIAPITIGGGTPLFAGPIAAARFTPLRVLSSPLATHVTYQVQS
jgi:dihydrofolate reductase